MTESGLWVKCFIAVVLSVVAGGSVAWGWPQEFLRTVDRKVPPQEYAEAWGVNPEHAENNFSNNGAVQVYLIESSAPATILWPGESASLTFQFSNLKNEPLEAKGTAHVIQYQIYTHEGTNFFDIGVKKIRDVHSVPFAVSLEADGWSNVTIEPKIPEQFGGYAVVLELEGQDRLFGASCVRTFKPDAKERRFCKLTMDLHYVPALKRLGATQNRMGFPYLPTTDPGFEKFFAEKCKHLDELKEAGLSVTIEFGAGPSRHKYHPLGRNRPWLDENDVMKKTKSDFAWLPSYDEDFRKFVKMIMVKYGWPNGPVNGVMLWNEPWEGISISGWGADMLRYREIYTAMAKGVEDAEAEADVDIWIGGCDSSSNTFDKLFSDGSDDYLKWLDFMSIHYQGTSPYTTVKKFLNRKDENGNPAPVEVWDTESWVANSDDRIAGVLAAMYSFGQKRVVGINSDCMVTAYQKRRVKTEDGAEQKTILQTWSAGAAIGAFQHFVGERNFNRLLFQNGLPFVMVFDGETDAEGNANVEDGTVVVFADMGAVFGYDNVLFRNCRSLAEVQWREEAKQKLAAMAEDDPEREALSKAIDKPRPYSGASMTITADGDAFGLYDFYGNPVPASDDGKIVVPLDARGFYLRGNGEAGSFAKLLTAVQNARIEGLEPLAKECLDMLAPVSEKPSVRLRLTNILNRPVSGALQMKVGSLQVDYPETLSFDAHETKVVDVKVTGGKHSPNNVYPLTMTFDAGEDGQAVHAENVRVNFIARKTITVDGDLKEWEGALPQQIRVDGVQEATLTEKAWLPFMEFDESVKKGFSVGYLAYDDEYFYFAAKITDTTPHPGTVRFETRDDEQFFYPEVCYDKGSVGGGAENFSVRWTGFVTAPADGDYIIWTRSDDGVRLWLNGEQVVDDWKGHPPTRNDAPTLSLKAGEKVEIKLEYFQGGGGAMVRLGWESKAVKDGIIPASALTTPDGENGLKAEYFRGTELKEKDLVFGRVDEQIKFDHWPKDLLKNAGGPPPMEKLVWPEGVRRYSYRKGPILPCGNAPGFDNIQIAFNVLSQEEKPMISHPPGTMPKYINYACTDYEYALNQVAPEYGGGTEVWRLRYPGMPHKHFYPRQPASPQDGPVKNAKLAVVHEGNTRITELAMPWSELPHVKQRLDAGETIKFSYKVNDSSGVGCMELSKDRSVAKRNGSFRADWKESWANELEFAFEK